jgi:predicted negative regulator of RcsB-dependent stress response
MVEIYDSHEQGEIVKKWLRENGSAMVMGLLIAFGGLFGFKQWTSWEENQKQQASTEFLVMSELLDSDQLDAAMSNYQTLKDEYSGSPYVTLGALQMARARLEADQVDLAIKLLTDVVEAGKPVALATIGRERLARVLLDQDRTDEALSVLDGASDTTGFEARFAEVRGDIYKADGRMDDAAASYREALESLEAGVGDRGTLELKLASINEANSFGSDQDDAADAGQS